MKVERCAKQMSSHYLDDLFAGFGYQDPHFRRRAFEGLVLRLPV